MTISEQTKLKSMLFGVGLMAAAATPALAQKGLDEPFQGAFKESLAGKTVAYVPVAMNFDLTEGWFAGVKKELEPYGVKVIVRDPNWSTNAGAQAVTTLISEKPAAMIIHNPDVQTYAKLLQRAENEGIYVIQINMGSAYRSSAFVGANWIEIGERDTEAVVNAEPDGYTVLLVNPANYINASLYGNLKFNFIRDIAPVASFNRVPNVMTVSNDVPARTVAEFIAYVKANPGKVNMASSGNGTSVHLSGEMFMAMSGTKMQHVPYRGAAPAITDMLGGQVQVIFDNMPSIIQHIRSGALRALAVTTAARSSQLPDVPTVAETVPGYEASALFGMGAPKKTPAEIVEKLNKEINAVLAEPDMKKRLTELGGEPLISTPDAFGAMIAAETEKWEKVVKFAGAHVE